MNAAASASSKNTALLLSGMAKDTVQGDHRPISPQRRGEELADVLDLADAFPARHLPTLDYPPVGR